MEQVDFFTACEILADELNVDISQDEGYVKRKSIVNYNEEAAETYHKNVKVVQDYLTKERGLTEKTINAFTLGADNHGNVFIPFVDTNGRYVGYALRLSLIHI